MSDESYDITQPNVADLLKRRRLLQTLQQQSVMQDQTQQQQAQQDSLMANNSPSANASNDFQPYQSM